MSASEWCWRLVGVQHICVLCRGARTSFSLCASASSARSSTRRCMAAVVVSALTGARRRASAGAARRGRTEGWDIGKGGAGAAGGGWRNGGGASPLCSIARQRARSAASSGHRAWREDENVHRLTYCSHAAAVHVGVSRGAPPPRPRVRWVRHPRGQHGCAAAGAPGPYGSRVPARQRSSAGARRRSRSRRPQLTCIS